MRVPCCIPLRTRPKKSGHNWYIRNRRLGERLFTAAYINMNAPLFTITKTLIHSLQGGQMKHARTLLVGCLLAGCTMLPQGNLTGDRSVIINPKYQAGALATQNVVNYYTANDINHLTIELLKMPSQTLAASADIPKAQLNSALTFNHLMAGQGYRIAFAAYKAAGNATEDIISKAGPWVDFTTASDDRPAIATLAIPLIDKDFNGYATSSLSITNGSYSCPVSENIDFLPPLVTTFAGTNQAGFASGSLSAARFNAPSKLAFDASGSLYITDTGNNAIRKIDAGTVSGSTLTVTAPRGVHSYSDTKLYYSAAEGVSYLNPTTGATTSFVATSSLICDLTDIQLGALYGALYTLPTSLQAKVGALYRNSGAIFSNPKGIYLNGDVLYVADTDHNQIIKLTGASTFGFTVSVAAVYGDGTAGTSDGSSTTARFNAPRGLALDSFGNLYVSDTGNHRIRLIDPAGNVTTYAGPKGASESGYADGVGTAARFNSPDGLAFDASGNLFVVDTGNHCIRKIQKVY